MKNTTYNNNIKNKTKQKQAQRRAAAVRSWHKSHGVIQYYRGRIFPHDAQNGLSSFSSF